MRIRRQKMSEEDFDLLTSGPWWLCPDWRIGLEAARAHKECEAVMRRIIAEEAAQLDHARRVVDCPPC